MTTSKKSSSPCSQPGFANIDQEHDTVARRYIPGFDGPRTRSNGSIYLDSYKIKEYRTCLRHGIDTRDHHYDVYLNYTYPGAEDIEEIVRSCARGCAIGTLIAAIISGGTTASAAIGAFIECVTICVRSQVTDSFDSNIHTEDMGSDDWSGH